MKIKEKAKEYNITLSELANLLDISRPTLNTYIEMHESKRKIPNEKYQIVFDALFGTEVKDEKEFRGTLDKFNKLIERDKILGTKELNPKKTDLINLLVDDMKSDLYSDDSNEDIYIFINLFLNHYKHLDVLKNIVDYFLVLNGIKELESYSTSEQENLSNYYRFFYEIKEGKVLFDNEYLKKFKNRIKQLKEQSDIQKDSVKNEANELIKKEIERQVSLGKNVKELNADEIFEAIKKEIQ